MQVCDVFVENVWLNTLSNDVVCQLSEVHVWRQVVLGTLCVCVCVFKMHHHLLYHTVEHKLVHVSLLAANLISSS